VQPAGSGLLDYLSEVIRQPGLETWNMELRLQRSQVLERNLINGIRELNDRERVFVRFAKSTGAGCPRPRSIGNAPVIVCGWPRRLALRGTADGNGGDMDAVG
jgi:hypothetical protein